MTRYKIDEAMRARLNNSFSYHAPFGDQAGRYEAIRSAGLNFANYINERTPASREQSLAITAIEEAVMRANQAIALNEKEPADGE